MSQVGKLIEDKVHRRGQLAPKFGQRLIAQYVHRLPHHDGEQKRKAIRRVLHDGKQRRLLSGVTQRIQVHFVITQYFAHLIEGEGCQARIAADDD